MGRWKPVKTPEFHDSGTPLPPDLWRRILDQLVADTEPHHIRGVRTAARDICNVRMVCKELYAIGESAFKHLSLRCPCLQAEALWNRFLIEPRALCLQEIIALARQLDIPSLADPIWADKPILTRKIFEQLRSSQPTGIPAAVLLAIREESVKPKWYLHNNCNAVRDDSEREAFCRLRILAYQRSSLEIPPLIRGGEIYFFKLHFLRLY